MSFACPSKQHFCATTLATQKVLAGADIHGEISAAMVQKWRPVLNS